MSNLIPLRAAGTLFPGRTPSPETLHRYAARGVAGVRLEVVHGPDGRYTSKAFVDAFLAAVDAAKRQRSESRRRGAA